MNQQQRAISRRVSATTHIAQNRSLKKRKRSLAKIMFQSIICGGIGSDHPWTCRHAVRHPAGSGSIAAWPQDSLGGPGPVWRPEVPTVTWVAMEDASADIS